MQKNVKNKIINSYVYNHQILTFYMIALRVFFFPNKICQVQLKPLILVRWPFPQIFLLNLLFIVLLYMLWYFY